jgi:hypothetical protein
VNPHRAGFVSADKLRYAHVNPHLERVFGPSRKKHQTNDARLLQCFVVLFCSVRTALSDPSKGHARYPNEAGGMRRVDARTVG